MAEDRPSQPQDFDDNDDEDRISKLPDCLLVEILSRLPETKYAIRTGTLSKRWEHLWTLVHSLVFLDHIFVTTPTDFYSLVDKTLAQRRTSKLKKFKIYTLHYYRFESRVTNWIHYAISCNVEELDLALWDFESKAAFPLDQLFFVSSCFTDLRLALCMFSPTGAIFWKNLRSLCITYGKLNEATIKNILSGSPVLETLELEGCYGYMRIDITSKSVKKLVFIVYMNIHHRPQNDIIEINAPNILSLTVRRHKWLGKILLLNVSSLVEAALDYPNISLFYLGNRREAEEEMLKAFILNLVHVKVLDRLKAKGFRSPTNLKALTKKSGWKNVLGEPV